MTERPPSASSLPINLVGVVCYFLMIVGVLSYHPDLPFLAFFILAIAALGLPIILLEVLLLNVHRRKDVGWLPVKDTADNARIKVRVLGLNATLLTLFAAYVLFPEYSRPLYNEYLKLFFGAGLLILGGGFLFINFIDRRLADKQDGFWQVGCLFRGRREEIHWPLLMDHAKRWIVKGFFLAIMIAGASSYYTELWQGHVFYDNFQLPESTAMAVHSYVGQLSFATLTRNDYLLLAIFFVGSVDVMFGALGYLLTLRVLDAHVRSTDPTWFGWIVCIICYPPFWAILSESYLVVGSQAMDWKIWLHGSPLFFWWGLMVLVFYSLYTLATVTMGLRVSNLTYRGLVTSGLYRYSKHPQYIAKWFGWLTMIVPFISPIGPFTAVRSVIFLFGLGFLYYWRARTEENHLSNYPEYVAYAEWIDQHGLFRKIGQWVPYLRYSHARAQASGSVIWQKQEA